MRSPRATSLSFDTNEFPSGRRVGWILLGVNPYEHFVATLGQKDSKVPSAPISAKLPSPSGLKANHDVGGCACPVTGSIWLEDLAGDLAVAKGSDLEVDGYGLSCGILGELYLFGEAIIDPGCFGTWCRAYVDLPDARTCIEFIGTGR